MSKVFHRLTISVLVLAACALAGCCSRSCAPAASSPLHPGKPSATRNAPLPSGYKTEAGDVLKVTVYGEDDLSGEYTVGPDGSVALPLVGAVAVDGKPFEALPETIAAAYRGDYLKAPKVSVEVKGRVY